MKFHFESVKNKKNIEKEKFSIFDYQTPGIIVFAILMLISTSTSTLAAEIEKQTIRHIKLCGINAFEYLSGITISWLLLHLFK